MNFTQTALVNGQVHAHFAEEHCENRTLHERIMKHFLLSCLLKTCVLVCHQSLTIYCPLVVTLSLSHLLMAYDVSRFGVLPPLPHRPILIPPYSYTHHVKTIIFEDTIK